MEEFKILQTVLQIGGNQGQRCVRPTLDWESQILTEKEKENGRVSPLLYYCVFLIEMKVAARCPSHWKMNKRPPPNP